VHKFLLREISVLCNMVSLFYLTTVSILRRMHSSLGDWATFTDK